VFIFTGEPTPTLENRSYPENFSSLRSVDLGNLEKSVVDKSITSQEEINKAIEEFNFTEDDDFFEDTSVSLEYESQPSSTTSTKEDIIPELSSFLHISGELISLFKESLNPNLAEDVEENLQPKQLLWEIEKLKIQ
ncbi:MAG: tetratricopeptide repeat protein, partial [bacterium]